MSAAIDLRLRLPLERFALDLSIATDTRALGVFGRSGAGKTSLVESIVGLRPGATGTIRIGDEVWLDSERRTFVPPERRDVGFVPQGARSFPHLDARGNIRVGEPRARLRGQDFESAFERAVALFELGPLLDQPATTLSGGERQRVALARAFCSAPRLLVLDEPLSSLDATSRRKFLPYLRRIRDELTIPMIVVSHSPLELDVLADHVVVLDHGRIVDEGIPSRIFAKAYVDESLGDEPLETVFPATVLVSDRSRIRIRLGGGPVAIEVRRSGSESETGATGVCRVRADAVILARGDVERTSASNVLDGAIDRIDRTESRAVVHVRLAPDLPLLLVELVPSTIERLELAVDMPVRAMFKASSVDFDV